MAHNQHHRAFTLIELVVSVSTMSILMIGIASALVIASRAIPSQDDPLIAQVDAAQGMDRLVDDLMCAQSVPTYEANSIVFIVPDRNNDLVSEQLTYSWSGTAGDPLLRKIGSGADETVVEDVADFTLTYELRVEEFEDPANPNESGETLLYYYDSIVHLSDAHVHNDEWWGQYFMPALPADAVSWSVTRVRFLAKRDSNDPATTVVELRVPNGDLTPSNTVVDSASMSQLSLSDSFTWIEKVFKDARGLSPAQGLCLTFTTSNSKSCKLRCQNSDVVQAGSALSKGTPAWNAPVTDEAILFYAFGTITKNSAAEETNRYRLVRVRINLTLVGAPDEPIETSVRLLNMPEV